MTDHAEAAPSAVETLAFEIGTEEIPAFDLHAAAVQLSELVPDALDAQRIFHGDTAIYSTPRRLIAVVSDVALMTEAVEEVFRGPAAKIAFDDDGNPTNAAIGFARGKGIDVSDLICRDEDGAEYVFATRSVPACAVADLLPDLIRGVIESISWPKSCRWGTRHELFSRPVRWLVALLGEEIVPVTFAGLVAGRQTCGHRVLAPGFHQISGADELLDVVRAAFIVPSEDERSATIRSGVSRIENETGLRAELPPKTFTEVVNLSEYPTVMLGTFDEEFLQVPEEIVVDAMLMHQRYFPLYDADGHLANRFIIVSNGDPAHESTIVDGNERVVAARLYDARFFYEEDLKIPLESYVDHLDEVVFQENLGTMRTKTDRAMRLVDHLAADAALAEDEVVDARRAAYLAKADLVTNAVIEFTSVQGIMGSYYAQAAGEGDRVAQAIADHYRPRFSGDEPPSGIVGRIVAVADKLDTICGLFAVDQAPTGSSDPFALRRAALGILTMLLDEDPLEISLLAAIDASLAIYADEIDFDIEQVRQDVIDFFITRTKVILRDEGADADAIDAVLAAGVREPVEFVRRVRALVAARAEQPDTFADLSTAFARANNLRDAAAGTDVDLQGLTQEEASLAEAVESAQSAVDTCLEHDDYQGALAALASLRAPIDDFFETTLIMDDDLTVRENRMRLLNRFVSVFADVADFGLMAKAR